MGFNNSPVIYGQMLMLPTLRPGPGSTCPIYIRLCEGLESPALGTANVCHAVHPNVVGSFHFEVMTNGTDPKQRVFLTLIEMKPDQCYSLFNV